MVGKRSGTELSPSEWRIMQVCWRQGRTTIREILFDLAERAPAMSYTTVHMLLSRIVEKGFLSLEQEGGSNYYSPAVERAAVVRAAAEDFVDNILAAEPANLEILEAVVGERKAAQPAGRKPN
jgi:predicted transcriptional regulator